MLLLEVESGNAWVDIGVLGSGYGELPENSGVISGVGQQVSRVGVCYWPVRRRVVPIKVHVTVIFVLQVTKICHHCCFRNFL